jgi:PAS domain S-box-containing protein
MEKMEEQLFEQLQLFRVLMDNIPNPVYYKNIDGTYLGYNKAFQEYFGLKHADHVGKTVFDLPVSREEAMLHHQADVQLIRQSGSVTYEVSVTCPDKPVR